MYYPEIYLEELKKKTKYFSTPCVLGELPNIHLPDTHQEKGGLNRLFGKWKKCLIQKLRKHCQTIQVFTALVFQVWAISLTQRKIVITNFKAEFLGNKTVVSWRLRQHISPKNWYMSTIIACVTTVNTALSVTTI